MDKTRATAGKRPNILWFIDFPWFVPVYKGTSVPDITPSGETTGCMRWSVDFYVGFENLTWKLDD
jgi:hypothetical protein